MKVLVILASFQICNCKTINDHNLDIIKKSVKLTVPSRGLCLLNNCCNISSTQSCDILNLPYNSSNLVFPGGSTRCIFSYSTPYAFQVFRGKRDKLLLYFQEGGACWDKATTTVENLCVTNILPALPMGVFNRKNLANHFRDYTVVVFLYCSGDIWGGNVTRDYKDKSDVAVSQQGYANAKASLEWVKEQQINGGIDSVLSDLVVMGASAGSLGVQLWFNEVLHAIKWHSASVVADSYTGLFPDGVEGPLIKSFGFCTAELLPSSLRQLCHDGKLTIIDIMSTFIPLNINTSFTFIQSKTDAVQMSYYFALAVSRKVNPFLTPKEFYDGISDILSGYSEKYENVLVYLIDGSWHAYMPFPTYYTASPEGFYGAAINSSSLNVSTAAAEYHSHRSLRVRAPAAVPAPVVSKSPQAVQAVAAVLPKLDVWLSRLPLQSGQTLSSVCKGAENEEGIKYCSPKLLPKTYVQT